RPAVLLALVAQPELLQGAELVVAAAQLAGGVGDAGPVRQLEVAQPPQRGGAEEVTLRPAGAGAQDAQLGQRLGVAAGQQAAALGLLPQGLAGNGVLADGGAQ